MFTRGTTQHGRSWRTGALAAAGCALLTLSACSSGGTTTDAAASDSADSADALKVVATTTQICDYVTQIVAGAPGDPSSSLRLHKTAADGTVTDLGSAHDDAPVVDLTCILAPNASAHDHELTRQQMKAFGNAQLLLVSGVDLEHFLDQGIESSGFHGTLAVTSGILTASEVTDLDAELAKEKDLPYTVFRGSQKVDIAKWPFPPEEGESEPEFTYDPHVWTSPKNVEVQVKNIGEALDQVDPDHKKQYNEAVSNFEAQLKDLDNWAAQAFNSVPKEHRVLFTSHDAFGYLSRDYGIDFIGAALSDFNSQQDATADHIAQAAKEVKDSGAVAIFAENSTNPKSIEAVGKAAGVKVITGEDALYGDSLGPDGSAGQTYIGSIIHNVDQLVTAWGGTVPPLPNPLKAYAPAK
ncbi:ABC transporter [Corynebacterium aquilae DSM 44791]|uniref:ABC transporter n=1 Tax=Corynebacterium aquilae DSM 44791 TaxID=1431546 RepID=A0A1L7CE72_9CORY|nr:ABC transporter [Corynebacterium aquilae DSM 44791]